MAKILLVEDDSNLALEMKQQLESEGHIVDTIDNGLDALQMLQTYSFEMIILDWQMPGLPGIEVCRRFRGKGGATPILMLTGMGEIAHREAGLDGGADDYLTKPFAWRELPARIRAILRRPRETLQSELRIKDLVIDTVAMRVSRDGQEIKLLPKEYALLSFLVRHRNQVFNADALINKVWSTESDVSEGAVRQTLTRLREKIDRGGEPSLIRTIAGFGYTIESD